VFRARSQQGWMADVVNIPGLVLPRIKIK